MSEMSALTKRLLAALFVLLVVAFVAATLLIYNKQFSKVDRVDLYTDDVGYNLPEDADVKVRGVLVGEVRSIEAAGDKVKVTLAIDPDQAENLPSNVAARLLPKTLFGERYVDLTLPDSPKGHLADVDTISQDRRGNSTELGRVLDGLLPVLQAVPPAKLAETLGALNRALAGNGDKLGASAVELGKVFAGIDEVTPQLESGLQDLATFSQTYSEAGPEIVHALDALRTTGNTVVRRRDDIADGLRRMTADVPTVTDFLKANRDDVIALSADSRVGLYNLGRYSGALPCAVRQFYDTYQRAQSILGTGTNNPGVHATVEIVNPRGRYVPNQDEPRAFENRGPRCYPSAQPGINFPGAPGGAYADGSYQPPNRNQGPADAPELPNPLDADPAVPSVRSRGSVPEAPGRAVPERANDPFPVSAAGPRSGGGDDRAMAYAGSPLETATVRSIYGAASGDDPETIPAWVAGLGAPALRGTEVTVR